MYASTQLCIANVAVFPWSLYNHQLFGSKTQSHAETCKRKLLAPRSCRFLKQISWPPQHRATIPAGQKSPTRAVLLTSLPRAARPSNKASEQTASPRTAPSPTLDKLWALPHQLMPFFSQLPSPKKNILISH